MTDVTPDFVQEVLMDDMISAMQKGNYVSAASGARNVLQLGQRTRLRPEIISVAQRVVNVLESKGYSEQRFLQEMAGLKPLSNPCPQGAVQMGADGTCPDGYFPLFADLTDKTTRRCCGKLRNELVKMEQEVNDMYTKIPDTSDRISFESRFMIKDKDTKMAYDEMLGIGITPHISHFVERHKQSEIERIEKKIAEIDARKASVEEVFGESMTPSLYKRLRGMFASAAVFSAWFVNHDWTYMWISIYIFRFITLFMCMYLRLAEGTRGFYEYFTEVVKQKWGISASLGYVREVMVPNILSVLMGSAFLTAASGGLIQFGGWIQSVLGSVSLTGRLISLFSTAGFVMDIISVGYDIWQFIKGVGTGMAEAVAGGNINPWTVVSAGVYKGTEMYCNQTLCTFFALAANMVGEATKTLFVTICRVVFLVLSQSAPQALKTFAGTFSAFSAVSGESMCDKFSHLIDQVMRVIPTGSAGAVPKQDGESITEYAYRMCNTGSGAKIQDLLGRPS